MEKLAFRYIYFKFKLKDEIYEELYHNDKEKINNLVKNDIIHFILGKKNLVYRDDCLDYLDMNYDSNYIDILDEILKNDCEKKVLSNDLVVFSLKKQILDLCDIDYIISFENREDAIEYMTNFQSTNFRISNTNIIEPLNIEKRLMKNLYKVFYSENNIDIFIKLYNLIYNHQEIKDLHQIFYFNLSKILIFAYKLCSTIDLIDEDFKTKLIEKLKKIDDKQLFKEKVNDDKSKSNLKEKLKKNFEKKNKKLNEKIISSNIILNEEIQKEQENCVYCHQSIYKDNNQYFGKIYYYFSDYITDILKKIPEGQRKKAKKFVSCNHKIHFKCFDEFIITSFNKENKEFECPLCKKLSNIILFDFSFLQENNYYIIKGINYIHDKIDMDKFYEKDNEDKLKEIFHVNILTFENYCSELFKKQILIRDFKENINLFENWFKLFIKDFEEFTIYYSRTNKKQEQIEIWKNILYNIRLLFKYKKIIIPDNILLLFEDIIKINDFEIFEKLLINYGFNDIINIFIIISLILFDCNIENIKIIKNIFNKNISLYFIYMCFIKFNNNDIDKLLSDNISEIKKALELYYLKYKICLLLFNEKVEEHTNIPPELTLPYLKGNMNFIKMIISTKKNNHLQRVKELFLEIPEFKIINLPERGIEFLNKVTGNCLYCNKKYLNSYLCLFCGSKLCNSVNCYVEDETKKRKEYSVIYHSKRCCGGNGLFISTSDAEIVYILKRRIIHSKLYIYLNDYGDTLKEKYLTDEYKLIKNELDKGIIKFINMSFRINNSKCYFETI